ncbi:hypothetical protein [Sphingomonas crocodyli]|uniref:Uncharacterized protein n=1 Tax=Sphingomonas crocodyli TaxID=1979270 RepID=A0A437M531_9SPHN|nr:hypothetical protein [Sphingomonas crocodyli]RVT92779.1 hypothetical protein EOD43_02340 [Sphingomonas crocodyli]
MKAWTAAAMAMLASAPAMAAPSAWTSVFVQGVHEYRVGSTGARADNMTINCPIEGSPTMSVLINGTLPPEGEQVGFRAAGQSFAFRTNDNGTMRIDDRDRSATFARFWRAVRAGSTLTVSFINGAVANLPLSGSAKALPALPCGGRALPDAKHKIRL